jgi:hypothetical protein
MTPKFHLNDPKGGFGNYEEFMGGISHLPIIKS